ncbi:TIGR03943 family protein [Phormidium pseudopriestleyi FRX01]|uniref:TIGR03943 family protein n=1 Tax=Phormidium pseudopriestleyi FRX01 TaxID=1759528 RepID=A0ABS3FWD6_9CYAN|nr:TIGR03943 family protein [Phormidium pseudopriestleyi]MBO0351435.1 TIGR03943 family protein [Phormidium pseudopriestleyi FRX01]
MAVQSSKIFRFSSWGPWIEVLSILAWGVLLLKYWVSGELNILIHPNFFALTNGTGVLLILLACYKGAQLVHQQRRSRRVRNRGANTATPEMQHITLFPPGWSATLLLVTAVLGFLISPRVFASEKAMMRDVNDFLPVTQSQPQAFRTARKPEERSLIDWVRTLTVYPEPDAYTGQQVNVQGFVIHLPDLPEEYFLISRFVITCCAADAYPVGLPVKLSQSRTAYPPDTWLEIQGEMSTEILGDRRQLTIVANSIQEIPEPRNPYEY